MASPLADSAARELDLSSIDLEAFTRDLDALHAELVAGLGAADLAHLRKMERWGRDMRGFASSGNRSFDDYREETLRRLEEEQREFREFLDRLRKAKDKEEFDHFMADRRTRPSTPGPQGGVPAV